MRDARARPVAAIGVEVDIPTLGSDHGRADLVRQGPVDREHARRKRQRVGLVWQGAPGQGVIEERGAGKAVEPVVGSRVAELPLVGVGIQWRRGQRTVVGDFREGPERIGHMLHREQRPRRRERRAHLPAHRLVGHAVPVPPHRAVEIELAKEALLGHADPELALRLQPSRWIDSAVADLGAREHVAEIVDLKRHVVAHARLGIEPLVLQGQSLGRERVEDGVGGRWVQVEVAHAFRELARRLNPAHGPRLLGDSIRDARVRRLILCVHLLAQKLAGERAVRLMPLGRRQRRCGGRSGSRSRKRRHHEPRLGRVRREPFCFEGGDKRCLPLPGAGVKPALRHDGREPQHRLVVVVEVVLDLVVVRGEKSLTQVRADGLGVPRFDVAKAPELALLGVVVAVPVAIGRHELVLGHVVVVLDALDNLHWKRKARRPLAARRPILEIEFGRRRIPDPRLEPDAVLDRNEEVRLRAPEQVDVPHLRRVAPKRRRPDEAARARAEQVHDIDRRERVVAREDGELCAVPKAIPRLVHPDVHAVCADVDEIGRARAIDVGEAHTFRIVEVRRGEAWRPAHRDHWPELPIAEVRPVADRAVPDAD